MRKKIIAGNWKMNISPAEAAAFAAELAGKIDGKNADVIFCVPFIDIIPVLDALKGTNIAVGAQNLHFEESGAYTGEISASMLKGAGVKYVIIGHSERRAMFGETDVTVNKKAVTALKHGLIPIICVGETLAERQIDITTELVRLQTKAAFAGIAKADAVGCVIAYEPVWAIGTGLAATSVQAQEVCAAIRAVFGELYGKDAADAVRIQYGGSVKGSNAKELFTMPDIDGGLVGGASLTAEFVEIVNY